MVQRNRAKRFGAVRSRRSGEGSLSWIYGLHAARAALCNPVRRIHAILATRNATQILGDALGQVDIIPRLVGPEAIAAVLPPGAVHQGIAIEVEPLLEPDLETLCIGATRQAHSVLIILDQVTDPQNVGGILRSAAAFGAAGLVVTRRNAPSVTGALVKAASGAVEHVPLVAVPNLARALDIIGEHGFQRIGLADDAPLLLSAVEIGTRAALVLGAEGSGLRRLTRARCDVLARLPTRPTMSSLNVAAAASAALYEFARGGN